jgi:hypothetical protein
MKVWSGPKEDKQKIIASRIYRCGLQARFIFNCSYVTFLCLAVKKI